MSGRRHRHWVVLLAVLALAFGATTHGVAAAKASAKLVAVATAIDVSFPSTCNGCSGGDAADHAMSATACFAFCNGSVAVLPGAMPLEVGRAEPAIPDSIGAVLERAAPPDPYPPRPAVLS